MPSFALTLTWDQAIDEFLAFMRSEKNASDNTISNYRADLAQLGRHLVTRGKTNPSVVSEQDLRDFVTCLYDKGAENSTVARKVASSRMFFDFTEAEGLTPTNPAEDLSGPKVPHKETRSLSDDQVEALLANCRSKQFMPKRDTSMISLAVKLGLTPSEIVGLQLSDFNKEEATLVVRLRRKERTISLPDDCMQDLVSYIDFERIRISGNRKSTTIFLGHHGLIVTRQGLWLTINECSKKVGITKCSPRLLRNTAVKRMLHDGVSEEEIRKTLGLSERSNPNYFR